MNPSFTEAFPVFTETMRSLYDTLAIIACVITFGGLCMAAYQASSGEIKPAIRGIVSAALVVVMISIFPKLTDLLQQIAHEVVVSLHADPSKSHQQFLEYVLGPEAEGKTDVGLWDVLSSDRVGFGDAIFYTVVLLLGKIAYAIMWLAMLLQNLFLVFGVAVAPLALASMTVEPLRAFAGRYFMTLTALICMPLGWAVADLGTKVILKLVADSSGAEGGFGVLFGIVVLSLWLVISTIGAPYAITKLLVSGSQMGSSLLKSVGMASSQGASYALGAGVSTSLGGGGKAATAMAATAAGVSGMISGATGNTGLMVPGAIGTASVILSSRNAAKDADQMAYKMREKKS